MTPALPPSRAETVGSLLRPPALLAARRRDGGESGDGELRRLEDEAVRDAVALQEDVGLRVVTDGEQRRGTWNFDFLEGFENVGLSRDGQRYDLRVEGPVRRSSEAFVDHFAFLRAATTARPKMTLPSPSYLPGRDRPLPVAAGVYDDDERLDADIASVYREEIAALAAAGCDYLQLDDPNFAFLCDPTHRDAAVAATGRPVEDLLRRYVRLVNDALRDRPAGMTVALHTCRGNFRGKSFASGGLDPVAAVFFEQIAVDGYLLEFDGEHAGGFEPLRLLPPDKYAVLGLVTTKRGILEEPDEVARRIDAATSFVPLDRLALSPQCGFASIAEGSVVTPDQQRRKLELVVEVAATVWG